MQSSELTFEWLPREAWGLAHSLLLELRPHLSPLELEERLEQQYAELGYEVAVAKSLGDVVCVAGVRAMLTLSRGRYLHVDDLIVEPSKQRFGVGRQMIEFLQGEATKRDMAALVLEARPTAIGFYERIGFEHAKSPQMRLTFLSRETR